MLIAARAASAVRVNGLFVAPEAAPDAVVRFCRPALFHNAGVERYHLSKLGSGVLLRYRGRNVALCCYHQLGDRCPSEFVINLSPHAKRVVAMSGNGSFRVRPGSEKHANMADLLGITFDDEQGGHDLRGHFLDIPLDRSIDDVPGEALMGVFAVGYPTFGVNFVDVPDRQLQVDVPYLKLPLVRGRPELLDEENRLAFALPDNMPSLDKPDGMSGSPVFFVAATSSGNLELGLAGLITSSNGRRFMVYSACHIRRALDLNLQS